MRPVWKKGDRLQLGDLGHTSGGGFPLLSPAGFGLEPLAGFIGIRTRSCIDRLIIRIDWSMGYEHIHHQVDDCPKLNGRKLGVRCALAIEFHKFLVFVVNFVKNNQQRLLN